MAPTTSKRSRPSFSPPRPGKSKVTKSTKDKDSSSKTNSSKVQKPKAKATSKDKGTSSAKKGGKSKTKQRGAGGTMRAFLDEADEDEDEEDNVVAPTKTPGRQKQRQRREEEEDDGVLNEFAASMDTDGSEDEQIHNYTRPLDSSTEDGDGDEDEHEEDPNEDDPSSPEPEFILAEITHPHAPSASTPSEYAIPTPLIHRIMHSSFTSGSTTLSTDAKNLLGKYIEVFVKESVRRCVDEKKDRAQGGGDMDTGWLEVEDLERVGGQVVLDF